MINVTYSGDTLVAYKVTGDKNVPKGEISFQCDLSPQVDPEEILEPIELSSEASKQWGLKYLSRFNGEGQIAGPGFTQPQFAEGQLILVNKYFSFAFTPLNMQVFFGRPSPELTIKLLRESEEQQSDKDDAALHLTRCMEETEHMMEEDTDNSVPGFSQAEYYDADGCFE